MSKTTKQSTLTLQISKNEQRSSTRRYPRREEREVAGGDERAPRPLSQHDMTVLQRTRQFYCLHKRLVRKQPRNSTQDNYDAKRSRRRETISRSDFYAVTPILPRVPKWGEWLRDSMPGWLTDHVTARFLLRDAMQLCDRPSVRLSVTSRSSTKMAVSQITQTTSYDSPGL